MRATSINKQGYPGGGFITQVETPVNNFALTTGFEKQSALQSGKKFVYNGALVSSGPQSSGNMSLTDKKIKRTVIQSGISKNHQRSIQENFKSGLKKSIEDNENQTIEKNSEEEQDSSCDDEFSRGGIDKSSRPVFNPT